MTIAHGLTNCEAERDIIINGFTDLLRVLKQDKNLNDISLQSSLCVLTKDDSLNDENRLTLISQNDNWLSIQEESNIRIRRTILIGLYSFWELSLKDIVEHYNLNNSEKDKDKSKRKNSVNDYLNVLFPTNRPEIVGLISFQLKELRNFMTHGSADKNRHTIVGELMQTHPEFWIKRVDCDYYLSSYDGLENILNTICEGLQIVEAKAKTLKEQTK